MTDLESRLAALRPTLAPPSEEAVAGDLRRARRAIVRRRALKGVTSGALVVAIAGAATAVVASGNGDSGAPAAQPASPSQVASTPPASSTASGGIQLVDYTGAQKPGFRVAKVPAGFVLQGATRDSLDIARADDHSRLNVFTGKLVVMLLSTDATFDRTGKQVEVNGAAGYIQDGTLQYIDGTQVVVVQSWKNIGLTDEQLVAFASGVTVTDAAQAPVG